MNKEQYDFANQYFQILDLFHRTGEYIGGCGPLFDYWEAQGLTGGYPIDRGCIGCLSGFLKTFYTLIKKYEENNPV